jgi:tetratricopeptide (TPR) repeat protein
LILRDAGQYRAAEDAFRKAIRLDPDLIAARKNMDELARTRNRPSRLRFPRATRRPDL